MARFETTSLKFPQARESLAHIEDGLLLFLASRSEEIYFESLYIGKLQEPVKKGKSRYYLHLKYHFTCKILNYTKCVFYAIRIFVYSHKN